MESDSDSSVLSEAPEAEVQKLAPIFMKAKKATKKAAPPPVVSPPRPKRAPSPPHEEVLADNPDIAFIVMFRSRFQEAFSTKTPHFGPQDIERGVVDSVPSPELQNLLCALLALVLNRKKPVERGHHGRALEEAIASHKSQWPLKWNFQNPIHGGRTFDSMTPAERLDLLRTLIIWSLSSSEAVSGIIKDKYKQQRHSDDENQPLSVQPWGIDGEKRRYFLVQGLDDHSFRVYREGSRYTRKAHWYSMAGTIDEVKKLAAKLENKEYDGSQAARRLAGKMSAAVPMFEATEEKRTRREYRQQRRAAFSRPEPGFGIYEGRTRGKRMRYTYDEDEETGDISDATSTRRSTRNVSARSTPFETGPQYTASGRQIRQPRAGGYGESLLSSNVMNTDELAPDYDGTGAGGDETDPMNAGGRPPRKAAKGWAYVVDNPRKRKHIEGYNVIDGMSDEDEGDPTGEEDWDSAANASDDENIPDEDDDGDDEPSDEDEEMEDRPIGSLVVKLKVPKLAYVSRKQETPPTSPPTPGNVSANALSSDNTSQRVHDANVKIEQLPTNLNTPTTSNGVLSAAANHANATAGSAIGSPNAQAEHKMLPGATHPTSLHYPTPKTSQNGLDHGFGINGHPATAAATIGSIEGGAQ